MKRGIFRVAEDGKLIFWCKGCSMHHGVHVDKEKPVHWDFNGDYSKPTLSPSILVTIPGIGTCHSYIIDGRIQYLSDCHHGLAGQVVDLE
jgi:hypothetical protein